MMNVTEVIVGPHTYEVTVDKNAINACSSKSEDSLVGQCDTALCHIIIDPEQSASQLTDTLLHEVLHACFELIGASSDIDHDTEEKLVRRLSPVLIQVLRDNPDLIEEITGG